MKDFQNLSKMAVMEDFIIKGLLFYESRPYGLEYTWRENKI